MSVYEYGTTKFIDFINTPYPNRIALLFYFPLPSKGRGKGSGEPYCFGNVS